jgi:L-2-hydroxyglutarate oxidase LhgO
MIACCRAATSLHDFHAPVTSIASAMASDCEVDVSVAVKIFEQFEQSKHVRGSAVRDEIIEDPTTFVRPVPHVAFVYGLEQVEFLQSRHRQMTRHHSLAGMQHPEDLGTIRQWCPMLLEGRRPDEPVAATRADDKTDVHFGTKVVTDVDRTISALLGASPGASVSANIVLDVIKQCFADDLASPEGCELMKSMNPTFDEDLKHPAMATRQQQTTEEAIARLRLETQ